MNKKQLGKIILIVLLLQFVSLNYFFKTDLPLVKADNVIPPYSDSFEGNDLNWTTYAGTPDLNNTEWAFKGVESALIESGAIDDYSYLTLNSTVNTLCIQGKIRVKTFPASSEKFSTLVISGTGMVNNPVRINVYHNTTHIITQLDERWAGTQRANGTTIIQADTTYVFTLYFDTINNTAKYWVNGIFEGQVTAGLPLIKYAGLGNSPAQTGAFYADDIQISTSYIPYTVENPPELPSLNNPTNYTYYNPSESINFEWSFNDTDVGDTQGSYELEAADNLDFVSPLIDTGKTVSANEYYNGTTPSFVGTYYWRVRTWDNNDIMGEWSTLNVFYVDQIQLTNLTTPNNNITTGSTAVLNIDGFHRVIDNVGLDVLMYDNFENFNASEEYTLTPYGGPILNETNLNYYEGNTSIEVLKIYAIMRDVTNNKPTQDVYWWCYFMSPVLDPIGVWKNAQGLMELRNTHANVIGIIGIETTDFGNNYHFTLNGYNMTPGDHSLGPTNTTSSLLNATAGQWYKVVGRYEYNATHVNHTLWVDDVEMCRLYNVAYNFNYTANKVYVGAHNLYDANFANYSYVDCLGISYNYPTNIFPSWNGSITYNDTLTKAVAGNYSYTPQSITDSDHNTTSFIYYEDPIWINFYDLGGAWSNIIIKTSNFSKIMGIAIADINEVNNIP